jgi:hypothetical protein
VATRTETVQFHSCDLCGNDCDVAVLTRLYGPLERGKRAQADICLACRERPIADLIAWIERRQQETALRPLRSLRGVGRT